MFYYIIIVCSTWMYIEGRKKIKISPGNTGIFHPYLLGRNLLYFTKYSGYAFTSSDFSTLCRVKCRVINISANSASRRSMA